MKTIKTILLWLMTAVIGYILSIILAIGTTAWFWVPFVFAGLNDGSFWLSFIIGIVVSLATYHVYYMIEE